MAVLQVLLTTIEVFEGKVLTELDSVYSVYKEDMKKLEEVWSEVSIDRALRWKRAFFQGKEPQMVKCFKSP